MIKKTYGAFAAALLLGLASCSDDNPWLDMGEGDGTISLALAADGTVKDAIPETKADGAEYFTVPQPSDFYVHLLKGDEIHTNLTHDEFIEPNRTFPTGVYTLKAFSGSLEDEGFDVKPYFEGSTEVTVLEGREAVASVRATLGHSIISVKYTDAFKSYMKDYSSKLNSEGHQYIDVEKADEGRNAFIVPGDVSVWVNFTDPQGRELSLMPARFDAEAAHRYQVQFDVNSGNVATPQLKISFITTLEQETVTIDLTDELFAAEAPEVVPVNFTDEATLDFLAGNPADGQYRFNVLSYGGLNSVRLTLNRLDGNNEPLPFQGEMELIGASEAAQAQIAAAGFVCKGVFRNPDKMAYVDFSGVPEKLPAGKYQISVVATDMLTRASKPVSAILDVKSTTLSAQGISANPSTHQGRLLVTYNGTNLDAITFKAQNDRGMMVSAPVVSHVERSTRAFEDRNYLFTITLPEFGDRVEELVEIYFNGKKVSSVSLPVSTSFDADAFATKVLFKVVAKQDKMADATRNASIEIMDAEGNPVGAVVASRDVSTGIITITGLKPATTYTYTVSGYEGDQTQEGEFTTETEQTLPNADFSSFEQTINLKDVKVGGKYYLNGSEFAQYQYTADITASTPTDWGNINNITCNPSVANPNTWYMVPSTYMEDGKVKVRTVAYSDNGPDLPATGSAWLVASQRTYFCQSTPDESALTKLAGQLFVGSTAQGGTAFASRPSRVDFDCDYNSMNSEKGIATVRVISGAEVIGEGSTLVNAGDSKGSVEIKYASNVFGKKATAISVVFKSTDAAAPYVKIPTGRELDENSNGAPLNKNIGENTYHAKATGSELTIDNVQLIY